MLIDLSRNIWITSHYKKMTIEIDINALGIFLTVLLGFALIWVLVFDYWLKMNLLKTHGYPKTIGFMIFVMIWGSFVSHATTQIFPKEFPMQTETFIENFLGEEIDVEFGSRERPNHIWVHILEDGVISKYVQIFKENDGKIYVQISDANQWIKHSDGATRPGPKTIHMIPIIDTKGEN